MRSLTAALLNLTAGLLIAASTPSAQAVTLSNYSWTGTCQDQPPPVGCGTGTAHASLVVQDYTPGVPLNLDNLVSFSYLSDKYSSGYSSQFGFANVGGWLNAAPFGTPFAADLTILIWDDPTHKSASMFETFSFFDGFWCFNACGHDVGIGSVFVQVPAALVPEPAGFALLSFGLMLLTLQHRRARSTIPSEWRGIDDGLTAGQTLPWRNTL